MVVSTVGAVGIIATAGPLFYPAVAGVGTGIISIAGGVGTAAAVAKVTGVGGVAGAVAAAVTKGTAAETMLGTALGSTSALGVSATVSGVAQLTTVGVASGPLGWLVLGTTPTDATADDRITFDCWKPVVREFSPEPSHGVLLKDIIADKRVKDIFVDLVEGIDLPKMTLKNAWDELFGIDYVLLPSGQMALHAERMDA